MLYSLFKSVRGAKKWYEILASISIFLVYFASHKSSMEFLTIWSPNSFNFAVGTAMLLTLYRILSNQDKVDDRTLWMFSIAVGLGATFHIYMITLIDPRGFSIFLSTLFEAKDWYQSLISAGKVLLGSILVILLAHWSSCRITDHLLIGYLTSSPTREFMDLAKLASLLSACYSIILKSYYRITGYYFRSGDC